MNKHDLVIEASSRIAWVIEISINALLLWRFTGLQVTRNLALLVVSAFLISFGSFGFVTVVYCLRRAFFTKELVQDCLFFKVIRHPMYVFLHVLLIGTNLLFQYYVGVLLVLVLTPLWYYLSLLEEEQMQRVTKGAYSQYKENTGMFFPKLKP